MQTNDNNIKNQSQAAEETRNKQTFYLQRNTADDDAAFKTDPSNRNTEERERKKKGRWLTFRTGGGKICQESFEQRAERGTRDANIDSTGEPPKPAGTVIRRIVAAEGRDAENRIRLNLLAEAERERRSASLRPPVPPDLRPQFRFLSGRLRHRLLPHFLLVRRHLPESCRLGRRQMGRTAAPVPP